MTTNQTLWLDANGLRVGGTQLVATGGAVGIGTASTYGALTVSGTATQAAAVFLGNVGIGTTTVGTGNTLAVFGGNIYVGSTNSGIVFADGTYQSTAQQSTAVAQGFVTQYSGPSTAPTFQSQGFGII
jgi:hypothetical protein